MPSRFFTADLHFCHNNILVHEPLTRVFESIEEHDDFLVKQWNDTVRSNQDTVWVLGDLVWGKSEPVILNRLNGKIKLVLGNHDILPAKTYLNYVKDIHGIIELERGLLLSHIPIHPTEFNFGIILNLHGHLHSRILDDLCYFNVGVDSNDLLPVPYEFVQNRLKELRRHQP